MNLDIDEAPEQPAVERVPDRQHHRREAQLEIDRRGQLALAANLQESRSPESRSAPIGFWMRTSEPTGTRSSTDAMSAGRRRQIEDRAFRRQSLIERAEDLGHAELVGDAFRPRRVEIIDAGDRKAGLPIGGEMRVDDDRARADGDDRLRMRRRRPGLAERGRVETSWRIGSLLSRGGTPLRPSPTSRLGLRVASGACIGL